MNEYEIILFMLFQMNSIGLGQENRVKGRLAEDCSPSARNPLFGFMRLKVVKYYNYFAVSGLAERKWVYRMITAVAY